MPPESLTVVAGVRPGDSVLAPARQERSEDGRESARKSPRVSREVLFWLGCAGFALALAARREAGGGRRRCLR
ncbi:hypothetical protein ACIBAG_11355 [Streptomyces sp. NPDC051243]|uniref:hypothetical protein n=1 Tax=Streptomyces sp. NPDC051243 TaxID=3365646 RepID=UPI0037887CAE